MATQNQHHKNIGVKIPFVKVLESLENFFQEVFKRGSGQGPEVLLFLSGSGASGDSRLANPAGRDWAREQPEFVEHMWLQKKQHHKRKGGNPPWLKFLKVLKNLFKKFPSKVWGKSPES